MLQRLVPVILALSIGLVAMPRLAHAQRWDERGPDRRERWEHERWERDRWERRHAYERQYPQPGFYAPPPVYYAPPPRAYYPAPPAPYSPPGVGLIVPFR